MSSIIQRLLAEPSLQDRMSLLDMPSAVGSGASTAPSGFSGGTPSHWEQVGRRLARQEGYTPADLRKLDYIVEHESGWDPGAVNESSGAYGIPQINPSAHPDVALQGDPVGQINWLLDYVQQRYGGVDNAFAFKQQHGWY